MRANALSKSWLYGAAFFALTAVGVGRIVASYSAFFQTADEGYHLACGVRWFRGRYTTNCLNEPPLARVAAALALSIGRARSAGFFNLQAPVGEAVESRDEEGTLELRSTFVSLFDRDRGADAYERTLTRSRLGILPFFVAASLVVRVWARRLFGDLAALAAVFLFQGLPLVLAQAGLVTTDMATAALVPSALYCAVLWLNRPSVQRSALLGLVVGLAILAKISAGPFLIAGAASIVLARWIEERPHARGPRLPPRHWIRLLGLVGAIVFVVTWAGYRFSCTPLAVSADRPHRAFRELGIERLLSGHPGIHEALNRVIETPIPLGDFVRCIRIIKAINAMGSIAFFRGEIRSDGWWSFFPTLIAVKTPLAFLIFLAIGCAILRRADRPVPAWQRLAPLLGAAAILLVAMTLRINVGLRHVLPMYPLLAIVAGAGLVRLASMARYRVAGRIGAAVLAILFAASSARAHPDYLPYFNELAGRHPERIVIDSDLDWGQDVKRLFAVLRELHAEKVSYACLGCSYLGLAGLPPLPGAPRELEELKPYRRASGWVAISEWAFVVGGETERRKAGKNARAYDWLEPYSFRRVGRSIRLYFVPPLPSGAGSQ